jgi:hypothetical protein
VSNVPSEWAAAAERIIAEARRDQQGWARLTALCDQIGHRFAGSKGLELAVDWATEEWTKDGLDRVARDEVMVRHWKRGAESAVLVSPNGPRPLAMLGLGNSPPTPSGGIKAEVIVARDFEQLDTLGAAVRGKIVLLNFPMKTKENTFEAYGEAVQYRWSGPQRAAKWGAAAVLVRSVTTRSMRTPHTGSTKPIDSEVDGVQPIPAAAISIEDADMLDRLATQGLHPVVALSMDHALLPKAPSANVIGELRGREFPDQIVLIGAHLDSWDVGHGAHDDGAGTIMTMQALSLLERLGLRPRRTIRGVLFTNEECGLDGGNAYFEKYRNDLPQHVAAMEADSGGFRPRGFSVSGTTATHDLLRSWLPLFKPLGDLQVVPTDGGTGADIGKIVVQGGVPGFGLLVESTHYFDYHHTEADTLDKVVPEELKDSVAAFTLMAYLAAEAPEPLPRQAPKPEEVQ